MRAHLQLPFKVESEGCDGVTGYAGLPLVIEALRWVVGKGHYRALRKALGYGSWRQARKHVETLVCLIAAGGDCIEDIERLRADKGLAKLLGFTPAGRTQLKEFLYRFHQAQDGRRLTPADDAQLSVAGQAQIRAEGPALQALSGFVQASVDRLQVVNPSTRGTLDVDATIIAAAKMEALRTYEGHRGYQPQMAHWAEQQSWVCDEFRDGNVPAAYQVRAFLERAFAGLPHSVTERRLRGDSALYDEAALTWADDAGIDFAVSADMSEGLRARMAAIAEGDWKPYRTLRDQDQVVDAEEREWAEVTDFIPGWARNHRKSGVPFRYIAIRVRGRQRDLLVADDERWRHFAVATNMDWNGERLLRWHREKQGTVEHGHHVMKNELAGGTLPCGRFGANAAWWRLNALVHNLLRLMQARALPEEMRAMRPKALRFRLLCLAGVVVSHARQTVLRLSASAREIESYLAARCWIAARLAEPTTS